MSYDPSGNISYHNLWPSTLRVRAGGNSNKKLILSLKKSIDSYKHEKVVLLNLIDHLFFSEKLSLEEQSEMSRQFFNKEDLVKYQWTTLTKYNGEDFFETDAEPSLDDSEDDGEFKEYLKEEYE